MIGRKEIADGVSYADARIEEMGYDLSRWCEIENIDLEGLYYVARQRAARAAYMIDGGDPRALPRDQFSSVTLSRTARTLIPLLTSVWLDGFAGRHGLREEADEAPRTD